MKLILQQLGVAICVLFFVGGVAGAVLSGQSDHRVSARELLEGWTGSVRGTSGGVDRRLMQKPLVQGKLGGGEQAKGFQMKREVVPVVKIDLTTQPLSRSKSLDISYYRPCNKQAGLIQRAKSLPARNDNKNDPGNAKPGTSINKVLKASRSIFFDDITPYQQSLNAQFLSLDFKTLGGPTSKTGKPTPATNTKIDTDSYSELRIEHAAKTFSFRSETSSGKKGVNIVATTTVQTDQVSTQKFISNTNELKTSFAGDLELFEICNMEEIEGILNPKTDDKEKPLIDKTFPKITLIDQIIYVDTITSQSDIGDAIKQMQQRLATHSNNLNGFLTHLKTIRQTDIHIFGTSFLDIRGRTILGQLGAVFNFLKVSGATQVPGYDVWRGELMSVSLSETEIIAFASVFQATDAVFLNNAFKKDELDKDKDLQSGIDKWTLGEAFYKSYENLQYELCACADSILTLYISSSSPYYMDRKSSGSGGSGSENGSKNSLALTFVRSFQYLLQGDRKFGNGKTCGKGRSIAETVQLQFLGGKSLYTANFMTTSILFFSEKFFRFVQADMTPNFQPIIEFDLLMIKTEYVDINFESFTNSIELSVENGVFFHVEFFNDLYTLNIREVDGSGYKKDSTPITLNADYTKFYLGFIYDDAQDGEDSPIHWQHHYYLMVEMLYRLYVIVRASPDFGLNSKSTLVQIYTAIHLFLTKMYTLNSNLLPNNRLQEVRYSLMTYICIKIGEEKCENEGLRIIHDNIVEPKRSAIEPQPSVWKKVWILQLLKILKGEREKNIIIDDFEKKWIEIKWRDVKCPEVTRREVFSSVDKNAAQVGDKKTDTTVTTKKYLSMTRDCTKTLVTEVTTLITNTLTVYKPEYDLTTLIERIWMLINGTNGIQKQVIRYVLIRVIVYYRKNPTNVPKGFHLVMVGLFQKFEDQFLTRLDYRKTAGVYGFFFNIFKPYISQVDSDGLLYIDRVRVVPQMALFDLYYFGHIAAWKTLTDSITPNQKVYWDDNVGRMRTSLSALLENFGNIEDENIGVGYTTLDRRIQGCRKKRFQATVGGAPGFVAQSECKGEGGTEIYDCTSTDNTDFATNCDRELVINLLRYMFTADVMLESVGVFDSFNYFSPDFLLDKPGKLTGGAGPLMASLPNHRFFSSLYLHTQDIRVNLESDMEDIPNYVLNKIVTCMQVAEDKAEVFGFDSKQIMCPHDQITYGGMFWIFRHAFLRTAKAGNSNLDSWTGGTPMGTTPFIQLMVFSDNYRDSFLEMCKSITPLPEICMVGELVFQWVTWTRASTEPIDPDVGLTFVEETLGLVDLAERMGRDVTLKSLFVRRRFVLLEALHVANVIFLKESRMLGQIKSSLDYRSADKGGQFLNFKIFEFTKDFETDDIGSMTQYFRFTFRKTVFKESERAIWDFVNSIFAGSSNIDIVYPNNSGTNTPSMSFLGKFINLNGSGFASMIRLMAMYAGSKDHYTLLVRELSNMGMFLDTVTTDVKYDDLKQLIRTTTKIKQKEGMKSFFEQVANNKMEALTVMQANLNEGGEEMEFLSPMDIDLNSAKSIMDIVINNLIRKEAKVLEEQVKFSDKTNVAAKTEIFIKESIFSELDDLTSDEYNTAYSSDNNDFAYEMSSQIDISKSVEELKEVTQMRVEVVEESYEEQSSPNNDRRGLLSVDDYLSGPSNILGARKLMRGGPNTGNQPVPQQVAKSNVPAGKGAGQDRTKDTRSKKPVSLGPLSLDSLDVHDTNGDSKSIISISGEDYAKGGKLTKAQGVSENGMSRLLAFGNRVAINHNKLSISLPSKGCSDNEAIQKKNDIKARIEFNSEFSLPSSVLSDPDKKQNLKKLLEPQNNKDSTSAMGKKSFRRML